MTPVVINPVEQIAAARRRLKRIAAVRAGLALFVPALTALILAATLRAIGAATWERMGYVLAPARLGGLRLGPAGRGRRGARRMRFAGLASLARGRRFHGCRRARRRCRQWPSGDRHAREPGRSRRRRPRSAHSGLPLFPLLWRRAAGYLERFDPNRAFAFEVRRPLSAFAAYRGRHARDARGRRVWHWFAHRRPSSCRRANSAPPPSSSRARPPPPTRNLPPRYSLPPMRWKIPSFRPRRNSRGWPKR